MFKYDYDTFGWRNSDKQGLNDLKRIYEELVPYYNLDTNRLYAAGISAGGTFAVMACFNQAIPLKGYLGVCTGFPSELSLESFAKHTRLKAYMVVGENDFNKPRQDSLRELYEKYSINYSYNMIDSMGHQYPDNFDTWLDSGINFLLKDHELD